MTDDSLMRRCHLAGLTRQQTADLTAYPLEHIVRAWHRLGLTERRPVGPTYPHVDMTPREPERPARKLGKPEERTVRLVQLGRAGADAQTIARDLDITIVTAVRRMQRLGFAPTQQDIGLARAERRAADARRAM